MSCLHPLKGFPIGETSKGKTRYKITPYTCTKVYQLKQDGPWYKDFSLGIVPSAYNIVSSFVEIPCGKCIQCRLSYSKTWSIRCMIEAKKYKDNCFITLTYNDDHVPKSWTNIVDDETGEILSERNGEYLSLEQEDLTKFFKRLRKSLGNDKVRYYACGEYGDETMRPHYHAILFGFMPDDLVFYKKTAQGEYLYTSKSLEKIWGKGNVIVGECTFESCAYVARYVMKKLNGKEAQFYEAYGIDKEFVTMSRRPGIARDFYELHKDTDLFEYDHFYLSTKNGSKSCSPFKYYKKLYDEEYPGDIHWLTDKQKQLAIERKELKETKSTKSYLEMLEDEEFVLQENSKKRRNAI